MLLLDIGNSRIKAAIARGDVLTPLPTVAHEGDAIAAIAALPDLDTSTPVWISHVLGAATEARLSEAVQARWSRAPHYARSTAELSGLRNAYREPERLGVDRWLVMLAAWVEAPHQAAVIIDAGTALTADVLDASGQHRGGFIAAGLLTSQRAVLGATRFGTRDANASYDTGLGLDTEACVRQGAMLGCLGAIDRAAGIADIAGISAQRWITGGDAPTLLSGLDAGWRHRPLLVLEGLRALARISG